MLFPSLQKNHAPGFKFFCFSFLFSFFFLYPISSHAEAPNKKPSASAIASAHPTATQAGFDILKQGGNAFDAAIAVASTLSVVEPYSSGLGGGGFWLLHQASDNKQVMIDAREKAPGKAFADMYLDDQGNVDRKKAINGPLAAGIPGQVAAFVHLANHYGKLPLSKSLAPAISAAQNGFPVNPIYQRLAGYRASTLKQYKDSNAIFLKEGKAPTLGHMIVQKDLANTLRAIAEKGLAGFYQGDIAKRLVTSVQANGGVWTMEDLKQYNIVERTPLIGHYRGAKIISAPPPSSGGIALISILNQLEQFDFEKMSSIESIHVMVEAMRRAYRDRAEFLGDSDFVNVPIERLTQKQYNQKLASSIDLAKATPSSALGKPLDMSSGPHTTHFSILDEEGNRVAATLSINLPFGSGFIAEGTGVVLNNEMDDFSAKPGEPNAYGLIGSHANAIAPGKRPLSSMTPTFVERDNQVGILGTPGGSRIITMVLLASLEMLKDQPVSDWVSRPRFHHQYLPDVIQHEPDFFNKDEMKILESKGHRLKSIGRRYGNMHAISWQLDTNTVTAASDLRGVGEAKVAKIKLLNQ
ncbi:MAG: gamma-glutamyltransferase [Pseudomonadales bacterium]|nr:gamma-glutamyltransferase [Pseudomonadales bacterium]